MSEGKYGYGGNYAAGDQISHEPPSERARRLQGNLTRAPRHPSARQSVSQAAHLMMQRPLPSHLHNAHPIYPPTLPALPLYPHRGVRYPGGFQTFDLNEFISLDIGLIERVLLMNGLR